MLDAVRRFRCAYGAGPAHLLVAIAGLAIAAYGLFRALELSSPTAFLPWFLGGIVGHDLVFLPLYSALGLLLWAAARRGMVGPSRVAALNHVRVPAVISGLMLLVYSPLILGLGGPVFEAATGRTTEGYLERWLVVSASLFAISALVYAIRLRRSRTAAHATDAAPTPGAGD